MNADHARDETLSALYRQGARDEPPAALDRLILEAARREVAAPVPRSRPWYLRWGAQAGLAATVVLTVAVVMLGEREHGDLMPKRDTAPATDSAPPATPAPAANSAPAPGPASVPASAAGPASVAAPPSATAPDPARQAASAQRMPSAAAAPPTAGKVAPVAEPPAHADGNLAGQSRSRVEGERGIAARPPSETPPAASAAGRIAEDVRERDTRTTGRAMPAPAPFPASPPEAAPAAGPALKTAPAEAKKEMRGEERAAPVQAPAQRSLADRADREPAGWLEEIRRLLREGRESEAREQLAAFRRLHPEYRLPDDLRLPK